MKKVKYKVSVGELLGDCPPGAICKAILVENCMDCESALLYFPKNMRYKVENGKFSSDEGDCGSFCIAKKSGKYYVRSDENYINVDKDPKWLV